MMDEDYRSTTLQVYTFMMGFSDAGGFMTILYLISELILKRF